MVARKCTRNIMWVERFQCCFYICTFYHLFLGTRFLFNIIIYLKAGIVSGSLNFPAPHFWRLRPNQAEFCFTWFKKIKSAELWLVQKSPYYPCLKASKRLPEFSGLKGKVYPGQLKPRYQVPQPRIDFNQNGLMEKDNNVYLMPPEIIIVKPV